MVGLVKRSLHKAAGRIRLTFKRLKEVLIDIENKLNNRPLGYIENDIQLLILTPNMILHGKGITIPSENAEDDDDEDFNNINNNKTTTRAMRYITKCKNLAWKRWTNEYLRSLRENHQCKGYNQKNIAVGEIFLLKGEEKNRGE